MYRIWEKFMVKSEALGSVSAFFSHIKSAEVLVITLGKYALSGISPYSFFFWECNRFLSTVPSSTRRDDKNLLTGTSISQTNDKIFVTTAISLDN